MNRPSTLETPGTHAVLPLDREIIRRIVAEQKLDLRTASIREVNKLVNAIEKQVDMRFIRMEFGIPGLATHPIAIEAEVRALRELGVAHVYAPFDGLPALKEEAARFVELFMNVKVPASSCVPTVGAMEGCFASLALAGRLRKDRRKVLFLDPGFPVNRLQARFLGLEIESLDFYDHRGDALVAEVERIAARGDVCAVLWSSPNNPTWITLRESELEGIARVCDRHEIIAIEDLAYFGMDVRRGSPRPGKAPFQPTVLRYTKHGISLVSSSKMFSYAGQRIGIAVFSPELVRMEAPDLVEYYGTASIGHAFPHGVLYPIAACVPESPQHGLLAMLRAANSGDETVFGPAQEYARRAKVMKRLFLGNGFRMVYDNDLGEPLADGFYFTVSHPAYDDGVELLRELLHYGISAITLETAGSCRKEGLRACVSLVGDELFGTLEDRLRRFREDHT
jgi:aspartate/methionine/tyrosine aminotransferase